MIRDGGTALNETLIADQNRPAINFGLEPERMTRASRRLSAVDFVLDPDRIPLAGKKRITFDAWCSLVSVLDKQTHG